MAWNVLSILNEHKLSNVLQVFEDNDINVACITESWFDAENGKFTAMIKEAGFEIVHAQRDGKRGGGTAIMFRRALKAKKGESSTSEFSSFEYSTSIS